jgi:FRG domain
MESLVRDNAKKIHSFQELINEVERIGVAWVNRWPGIQLRCYFRGANKASYSLDPSLLREPFISSDMEAVEDNIRYDFETRGRPFLPLEMKWPWEELFIMQHHGFPTRLLDWTENISTALYFACRDRKEISDGAIWVLFPSFLIFKNFGKYRCQVHPEIPGIKDYGFIKGRRNLSKFNQRPPLPIMPYYVSPRLTAQIGRFTAHTFQVGALDKLANEDWKENGEGCFLHQILIDCKSKNKLLTQARMFGGASEETLFPDLDGLSRGMMWEYQKRGPKGVGSLIVNS